MQLTITPTGMLNNAVLQMLHIIHCDAPRRSSMSRHWEHQAKVQFEVAAHLYAQDEPKAQAAMCDIDPDILEYMFLPPRGITVLPAQA